MDGSIAFFSTWSNSKKKRYVEKAEFHLILSYASENRFLIQKRISLKMRWKRFRNKQSWREVGNEIKFFQHKWNQEIPFQMCDSVVRRGVLKNSKWFVSITLTSTRYSGNHVRLDRRCLRRLHFLELAVWTTHFLSCSKGINEWIVDDSEDEFFNKWCTNGSNDKYSLKHVSNRITARFKKSNGNGYNTYDDFNAY